MLRENISALPILDTDHRPVGILTTTDILRALVSHAPLEVWT
jgi:CBS domain-containing protein